MDDAVAAAFEVGFQPRQAPGQFAEEAVVEPPDPRLRGASDNRTMTGRTWHDLEVADHVDDPEPGDQVTRHRARNEHLELAGYEVDQQRQLAVHFGAGQLEAVATDQLRGDREPAF